MKNLEATSLRVRDNELFVLDQKVLPDREDWILCDDTNHMVSIIKNLNVRGAPLIGISASLALALMAEKGAGEQALLDAEVRLRASRPTAVNLMICLDRMRAVIESGGTVADLVGTAENIFDEDVLLCQTMSEHGAALVNAGDSILTHCNTGGLATAGVGTALGVIRTAHEQGKQVHVYVDETRPLLQGGRLTTWELEQAGIPHTLICDNMAGFLMQQGKIQKVFVGADRIAVNGDFANKVGTYSVAVLAHHHGIPFFPVAPYTTIDSSIDSGQEIPIEERKAEEVQGVHGSFGQIRWAPEASAVYNPAFDITPVDYVTALVLDTGVVTQKQLKEGFLKAARR